MTNLINSILYNTDSYKIGMWLQYPPGTEYVYSYIEARGDQTTLFFGLQSYIKNYLLERVTKQDVELANKYWLAHGEPFNYEGWMYIAKDLGGLLPLEIHAPLEGLMIPSKNALVTVVNTDPKCAWLTTWIESSLLRAIWYPTTVASNSKEIKNIILSYLKKSGDPESIPFKLHDFGHRGAHSNESASLGAAGHLINFRGTDTFVGVLRLIQDYDASIDDAGFSIPAAEHSTITSWGRENEVDAYANMIKQFSKPGSVFAVVSDSYDIYKACEMWGTELKDRLIENGGTLVIRPDSGDPLIVLPKMMIILDKKFGSSINTKGYRVLNTVKLIWGDGINKQSIQSILRTMVDYLGWSADNFAFGMGGALLGAPQRDDNGWAMKCSSIGIREELKSSLGNSSKLVYRDVLKDPITAPNKKSKVGLLVLFKKEVDNKTVYETFDVMKSIPEGWNPASNMVYMNGLLIREQTIKEIRNLSELT